MKPKIDETELLLVSRLCVQSVVGTTKVGEVDQAS